MQPLIDADVLLHEIGWSCEFPDKQTKEAVLLPWESAEELLLKKIDIICEDVGATKPPVLFISDSQWLTDKENKARKFRGEEERPFVSPFRYDFAKTKPYKGTRKNPKPFHFYNLAAYMLGNFDVQIGRYGLEADDYICQVQFQTWQEQDTIICSRDKDLRICPGWHYSWECGKQNALGPHFTDELGRFETINDKFVGFGKAFFYYQMLVGDAADNIPGLPGYGHARAVKLLAECKTEMDYFNTVKQLYKDHPGVGPISKSYFLEQANLLWMQMDGPYQIPKGT